MSARRCVAYRPAVLGRAWSHHQGKKRLGAGTREQALGEAKDNRKQARLRVHRRSRPGKTGGSF